MSPQQTATTCGSWGIAGSTCSWAAVAGEAWVNWSASRSAKASPVMPKEMAEASRGRRLLMAGPGRLFSRLCLDPYASTWRSRATPSSASAAAWRSFCTAHQPTGTLSSLQDACSGWPAVADDCAWPVVSVAPGPAVPCKGVPPPYRGLVDAPHDSCREIRLWVLQTLCHLLAVVAPIGDGVDPGGLLACGRS